MQIGFNLSRDFERCLEDLRKKYGEDFEFLNGVHPSQLDFSEFLSKFIDTKTMADATIDPNANASHKDIRSFMTEKSKSWDKLFALNKIFLEIKKKWGLKTAKQWLEQEFSKGLYLNDASTASYYPYCYLGSEIITIKYKGKVSIVSFNQLYDIVDEPEQVLNEEDKAFVKYPENLYVLDIAEGQRVFTHVSRVVRHKRNNRLTYVKLSNGLDQIVTEDHKMITTAGEKPARELKLYEDYLTTISIDYDKYIRDRVDKIFVAEELYHIHDDLFINDSYVTEKNCRSSGIVKYLKNHRLKNASKLNSRRTRQPQLTNEVPLTKELGYVIGMIVTDGTYSKEVVGFSQNKGLVLDRFLTSCEKCNIPVIEHDDGSFTVGNTLFMQLLTTCFLKKGVSSEKELLPQIFTYNKEFLVGLLSGIIDGDGSVPKKWNNMCTYYGNSRTLRNQFVQLAMIFGFKPRCQMDMYDKGFHNEQLEFPKYMFGAAFRVFKSSTTLWSVKFEQNKQTLIDEELSDSHIRRPYSTGYGDKNIISLSDYQTLDETVFDMTTDTHHFICNNILSHNCWANDFSRLAKEGLFFLNSYNNEPPKHLTTYFDDVIEFVSFLSNRQSGAVGMPNVLVWAWWFWKHDCESNYYLKDKDTYLRQNFQKFIYRLNQPFLRIDQCAFTNISIFDREYLTGLFGGLEFPDGKFAIDYIEDILECQKVFMEVVSDTRETNMFTFPVLTFSLLYKDNKFVDEDFAKWACKHNMKWSDSNFFVSDNVGVLSNCCRLLSDTNKLDAFVNSIGGSALSVGSCRVSTINLVRIAYESKLNKKKYLDILKDRVLLDCKALYSMRYILKRNIEKGLLPNYQDGALELDKQFCTIGGIGLYEVMDMFGLIHEDEVGNKSYSDEAVEFATEILDTINEVKDNFDCDFSFNVEMIPGENAAGVICHADNLLFESDKYQIYSNQWIPLSQPCTISEKCRLGRLFDAKCGGGCIAHIDIENRFPTFEAAWDALNYVASNGVIYFAFTTKINVCSHKHAFMGTSTCPICGEPIADQYSRVVGFYVPTSSFQKARKEEFKSRKWYNVLSDGGFTYS